MKPPIFSCLTSRVTETGSLYGRFLFGPLPIDISLTVATILRRSLLHTKNTFSIVSAEIEGAIHEYAALAGVQESVLEILLNLGEIVLASKGQNLLNSESQLISEEPIKAKNTFSNQKQSNKKTINVSNPKGCFTKESSFDLLTENPLSKESPNQKILEEYSVKNQKQKDQKKTTTQRVINYPENYTAFLRISGPCIVTAKDISWPDGIFCVKPDAYIATLSNNHTLAMRLKITSLVNRSQGVKAFSKNSSVEGGLDRTQRIDLNLPLPQKEKFPKKDKKNEKLTSQIFSFFSPVMKEKNLDAVSQKEELKEKKENTNSVFFAETSRTVLPKWGNLKLPLTSKALGKESNVKRKPFANSVIDSSFLQKEKTFVQNSTYLSANKEGLGQSQKDKNSKITELVLDKPWGIELPVSSSSYPVEKVNFLIERDDQLEGYRHRIIFEIWTNGSISPRQAIFNSIGWIIKLLYNFREPARTYKNF